MKTLLFIFISIISLNAETSLSGKCVNSFYFKTTGTTNQIFVYFSATPTVTTVYAYSASTVSELTNGLDKFVYNPASGWCKSVSNQSQQYLLSSLTGILIGFTIMFFAIFLTIKVGSKK